MRGGKYDFRQQLATDQVSTNQTLVRLFGEDGDDIWMAVLSDQPSQSVTRRSENVPH